MKTYHLFISHSWNHHDHYTKLVQMLDQAPNFRYRDFSIPKNDPVHSSTGPQLSAAIRNQMESCGIVLVMAGVYASYSKWMEKEMYIAKSTWKHPKPILGIKPWGNEKVSHEVQERASWIAEWNTNSIVSAIRVLA